MEINFENDRFSDKGCQSLHITHVMRIHKMLIIYVKLGHTLYSLTTVLYIIVHCIVGTITCVSKINLQNVYITHLQKLDPSKISCYAVF